MQYLNEHQPLNWLLKSSWQAAVLILLVLAAQWVFRRPVSPRWRYSLWLLVVIRLALPFTVASPTSLFNLLKFGSFSSPSTAPAPEIRDSAGPFPTASTPTDRLNKATLAPVSTNPPLLLSFSWLAGVWLTGASSLTIFVMVTQYRLCRSVAVRRPFVDAAVMNLLEDCKQEMRVRVPVTLIETPDVGSPALLGFVRPCLLLPAGLTRTFSLEELRHVFLHELAHIKRHDIFIGWLATILQILHWFNPLVWVAFHRMRVDRELACDALALSHASPGENQPYGQTIIKLLESFGRSAWAPSLAGTVENRNQLKERIDMIAKFKKNNRGLAAAMALFAGLGLITLTDAETSGTQANRDLVGTWILVGKPGEVGLAPAEGGRLKSLTETHWSMTQTDPKDGVVIFHHGGTYTLKGNDYAERVEFANSNTKDRIGKNSKFKIKLEGDTLTLVGVGNHWNEVWKRVPASKPHKLEAANLQGTWTGQEEGGRSKGNPSLVIRGSTFEFHGADTNEWYKARFSVYDTEPKQLVGVITECPFPQYVGRTSYAIYELEDGKLMITGYEPGTPVVPPSFDAANARKFVFQHQ